MIWLKLVYYLWADYPCQVKESGVTGSAEQQISLAQGTNDTTTVLFFTLTITLIRFFRIFLICCLYVHISAHVKIKKKACIQGQLENTVPAANWKSYLHIPCYRQTLFI